MDKEKRVELMMQFEDGTINDDDLILLFTDLIDSGMIDNLQGAYGRAAEVLIDINISKRI